MSTTENTLEEHPHEHPSEQTYVKMAIFLGVVTAIEVGIIYVERLQRWLVLLLTLLMVLKFWGVAAYFMHLKFDSKIFRRFFVLGIVLALAIFGIVLWMFTYGDRLPGAAA